MQTHKQQFITDVGSFSNLYGCTFINIGSGNFQVQKYTENVKPISTLLKPVSNLFQ